MVPSSKDGLRSSASKRVVQPLTPKDIVNLGLGKITSSFITSLSPPSTPLEKRASAGYAHWRNSELAKRRWAFAWRTMTLTQSPMADADEDEYEYRYTLPDSVGRVMRGKRQIFQIRDGYLYSNDSPLRVAYIAAVSETEFDPLFIDVVACRVAKEMMRSVPLDVNRGESIEKEYKDAIRTAGVANAFLLPDELHGQEDYEDDWVIAREIGW